MSHHFKSTIHLIFSLFLFSSTTAFSADDEIKKDQRSLSEIASAFEKGKTTYSDVVSALGTPSSTDPIPSGGKRVIYQATFTSSPSTGNQIASALIPFVSRQPTRTHLELVQLDFDKDGIMTAVMINKI